MKNYLYFIFCVSLTFWVNSISGQNQLGEEVDSALTKNRLLFNGNIGYQSTSIRQEVSRALAFGGFISDESILASFDKHRAINKAGFSYTGTLIYDHLSKALIKKRLSWGVQFGIHQIHSAVYSKSFFGGVFRGLSEYKGDTIQFGGLNYSGRSMQKLGLRLVDRMSGSFVALNLVQMGYFQDVDITKGYIYQNPEGTKLDVLMNGDWTSTSFPKRQNGFGFGIDAAYKFPVQLEFSRKKLWFEVKLENLGAVYYPSVSRFSIDTTITYTGFSLDQLNNTSQFSTDYLIDTLNVMQKTRSSWKATPTYFQVSKLIQPESSQRFQSFFGIRFYPFMNITPLVFVGGHYQLNPTWYFRLSGTYGGFGLFRMGAAVGYKLRNFNLFLGSDEPLSFVIKSFTGQSLSLRMIWSIG